MTKLSEQSLVSIGLVITVVVATAAGAGWAATVSHRLGMIEQRMIEGTGDRWTGSDMRAWVRAANQEVLIWSSQAEQRLDLPVGTWHVFAFPDPDEIRGKTDSK